MASNLIASFAMHMSFSSEMLALRRGSVQETFGSKLPRLHSRHYQCYYPRLDRIKQYVKQMKGTWMHMASQLRDVTILSGCSHDTCHVLLKPFVLPLAVPGSCSATLLRLAGPKERCLGLHRPGVFSTSQTESQETVSLQDLTSKTGLLMYFCIVCENQHAIACCRQTWTHRL